MMPPADLMGHLLDILVCRLRFLRIHYINIVIPHGTARIPFDLVGVKYQNKMHLPVSLEITQDIHQLPPGAVQIGPCQFLQGIPGKDDIVAVHQEIFFL